MALADLVRRILGLRGRDDDDDDQTSRHISIAPLAISEMPTRASHAAISDQFERQTARAPQIGILRAGIATKNVRYNKLIDTLERVALRSLANILIQGATGTGKTRLVNRLYQLLKAEGLLTGKLVEVNCATLHAEHASSELFGHVKGAFTGAVADRIGKLLEAAGGLLFLDEIGELPLAEQARLLLALQTREFEPLGSNQKITSNFRLVCGTNRDLAAMVAAGTFRADLYARIKEWIFELPTLAERREDIEPNLDFELDALSAERDLGLAMTPEARARWLAFSGSAQATWPDNFRGFSDAISRMATMADHDVITLEVVEDEIARLLAEWARLGGGDGLDGLVKPEILTDLSAEERVVLANTVRVCKRVNSLTEAWRQLHDKPGATPDPSRVRKYLDRHGLTFEQLRGG